MKTNIRFWSQLARFFLEWDMFETKCVEKIKTHILCSIAFSQKLCLLGDNVQNIVEPGRSQLAIWRLRIPCWITKATDKNSEYVILSYVLLTVHLSTILVINQFNA